jgi:phosphatidylglycerophosphate synthase
MVPFANIPEMARVAEHLFLHPEIIPQISQQAKDTVIKRFSSTMMIRNYEGLYERLHGVGRAEGEDVKKFLRLEGEDPLYQKIFMRKFSLPLSRILVHTPITPNQVTFLSFLFSIAGISCLFFYDGWLLLISVLLMQIGYLLDSIDGEIARFKNLASVEGFFLDFCAHRVLLPLRLLGFSLLLWKATSLIIYPIFGIFGVFFSLYSINAIENAVIFKSALKNKVTLSFHKLDSGEERNTGLGKIYFLWTDTPVMNLISLAIIFDLVFFSGCGNLFKSFILFFYGLSFPLVKMIKFALWVKFKKTGKLYSRLTKE